MPQTIYDWLGLADYLALAIVALFGAYCCVLVWNRVGQKWFKTEGEQDAFLESIEADLLNGNFEAVESACESDQRAVNRSSNHAVGMSYRTCLRRGRFRDDPWRRQLGGG